MFYMHRCEQYGGLLTSKHIERHQILNINLYNCAFCWFVLHIILHSACHKETSKVFAVPTETQHDDDKKKQVLSTIVLMLDVITS
jgi:hypothetical protein